MGKYWRWQVMIQGMIKALMLGAFTTFSGRLFQESTTWCVKVCLPNKSQLLSLNSFRLWPWCPVELNTKNLEKYMSSYPIMILQHASSISSELKCWYAKTGESDVVWFMPKVSWTSCCSSLDSYQFMSRSLNGDHTLDAYSTCGRTRAL